MANVAMTGVLGAALNVPERLATKFALARKAKEGLAFQFMDMMLNPPLFKTCVKLLLFDKVQTDIPPDFIIQSGIDADDDIYRNSTMFRDDNKDYNTVIPHTIDKPEHGCTGNDADTDLLIEMNILEPLLIDFTLVEPVDYSTYDLSHADSSPTALPTCWNDVDRIINNNHKSLYLHRSIFTAEQTGFYNINLIRNNDINSNEFLLDYQLHRIHGSSINNDEHSNLFSSTTCINTNNEDKQLQTSFLGCFSSLDHNIIKNNNEVYLFARESLLITTGLTSMIAVDNIDIINQYADVELSINYVAFN
jgi:hypothetical protein